ncbi:MAG: hypothetical protein U9R74_13315, partial [Pseudomonadota bacterium]|nr:hypothetical protein [Pseudomonadota bacterium]
MRHARAARLTLIAAIACSAATVCATETTGGNGVAEEGRSEASSPVTCGDADLSALAKRVYVSPQGVDSASCGATPTPPGSTCKTIHQGISNCTGSDCGVLVRWGLYPLSTTIELVDGVSLYGSCRFDDSTKLPYRSMLKAPADGKPGISATDIDTATMVYGLVVLGSHATTPGQASIAMTVSASKGLTISHTVLSAGKGGDGATPVPRRPAQKGGDGGPGDWQQFGFKNAGGSSGPSCDATSAGDGGAGADFRLNRSTGCFITCKCTQRQGASGATGQSSGNVAGGVGGHHGGNGRLCGKITGIAGPGGKGKGGSPGACGTQGGSASTNAWGRFSDSRWVPALGGSGGIGDVGSGGGGGGAGGVCTHIDGDTLDYIGLPGGGVGGG